MFIRYERVFYKRKVFLDQFGKEHFFTIFAFGKPIEGFCPHYIMMPRWLIWKARRLSS